jgi:hypothetical protein
VRRGKRFGCVALISALFLCVELILVSSVSLVASAAISIGVISADFHESTEPHGKSEPYWIRINIPAFKLTLFSGESPIKEYPIAVGKGASPSRIGTCVVINKAKYPTWYPPDGRPPVPPGPDNPISCRWLGLSWAGYGIHGTNNPASVGRSVTLGCIRMLDKDVMELFDIVPVGTKVEFTYETVEVSSKAPEPMSMRLTVYRDLYQLGTNTVERVMDSIRTSLSQIVSGTTPDMMSDAIPDIDRQALATLVKAAGGKPEPIPWKVRVELCAIAESLNLAEDSQDPAYSGCVMTDLSTCAALGLVFYTPDIACTSVDLACIEMDIARIEGDRVLVALRPIAEAFGHKVGWDTGFQVATVDQRVAEGVVREGRFYVTPDELQYLLEDAVIAWDPQTLTLRIAPFLPAEPLYVDW